MCHCEDSCDSVCLSPSLIMFCIGLDQGRHSSFQVCSFYWSIFQAQKIVVNIRNYADSFGICEVHTT